MRFITLSFALAMFLLISFSPTKAVAAQQYVEITEPFVNVYEFLDPKSTVLSMVKKNDLQDIYRRISVRYGISAIFPSPNS